MINELYYNLLQDLTTAELGKKYGDIKKNYDKIYDKILHLLSKDDAPLLDELFILTGGLESAYGLVWFKTGLKFALSLIKECT